MLGCSPQTISNWVKRGILRSHKVNNMVLIDKVSIEQLLDTASEVAEMEKKLLDRKKDLLTEIERMERKTINLGDVTLYTIRDRMLRSIIDQTIAIANDKLDKKDAEMVSSLLYGKSSLEIAKEMGYNDLYVRNHLHKAIPIIIDSLDYSALREENQRLLEENRELSEELNQIRERKQPSMLRNIRNTPFEVRIEKMDFSVRVINGLSELDCFTLADLVTTDELSLMKSRRMGGGSVNEIKSKLESLGLRLGMNLNRMSDGDFAKLVERLKPLMLLEWADGVTLDDINKMPQMSEEKLNDFLNGILATKNSSIASLNQKLASAFQQIDFLEASVTKMRDQMRMMRPRKEKIEKELIRR
jgi:hypothetical protein